MDDYAGEFNQMSKNKNVLIFCCYDKNTLTKSRKVKEEEEIYSSLQLIVHDWREPGQEIKAEKQEHGGTQPTSLLASHGCSLCFLDRFAIVVSSPCSLRQQGSPSQECHHLQHARPSHFNRYKRKYNLSKENHLVYTEYWMYIMLWGLLNV